MQIENINNNEYFLYLNNQFIKVYKKYLQNKKDFNIIDNLFKIVIKIHKRKFLHSIDYKHCYKMLIAINQLKE